LCSRLDFFLTSSLAEEFDEIVQRERIYLHEREENPLEMEKRLAKQLQHFDCIYQH